MLWKRTANQCIDFQRQSERSSGAESTIAIISSPADTENRGNVNDHRSDIPPTTESWDTYWQGAKGGSAYSSGGSGHPIILSFWDEYFAGVKGRYSSARIIDIASGSGAVVERARSVFSDETVDFTCLDISPSAVNTIGQRFPEVHGLVADARSIPLDSASCDIVVSQFGIEYAGLEAIDELLRLIATDGQLALLLHHRGGGIYRQCAASLDAVQKLQEARFIPYSIAMFEAGFAACRGADLSEYEAAARQFVPALRAMESIMSQHGPNVADNTIIQLYKDVRAMHKRIAHFDPTEVIGWLKKMHGEIQAYAGRMASMCDAAIDAETFARLCESVQRQGLSILRSEPLTIPERNVPLAWALVASRTQSASR